MIHHHVLLYPVVLMEDVMRKVGIITEILRVNQGGKYVFTKCQLKSGKMSKKQQNKIKEDYLHLGGVRISMDSSIIYKINFKVRIIPDSM
jgi:hypothetical protein